MSESKSDALTNLATPLHRRQARTCRLQPTPVSQRPAQPASEWRSSERHILPDQPEGQSPGIAADGIGPLPARAKTALPEPVIRLLPKVRCNAAAARRTSGQRLSAAACRSFLPKPSTSRGPASRAPPGSASTPEAASEKPA